MAVAATVFLASAAAGFFLYRQFARSGAPEKLIVGTWRLESVGGATQPSSARIAEFRGDGTGTFKFDGAATDFTYNVNGQNDPPALALDLKPGGNHTYPLHFPQPNRMELTTKGAAGQAVEVWTRAEK